MARTCSDALDKSKCGSTCKKDGKAQNENYDVYCGSAKDQDHQGANATTSVVHNTPPTDIFCITPKPSLANNQTLEKTPITSQGIWFADA